MAFDSSAIFGWKELELRINGRRITGMQGVQYRESQEKEPVYGRGVKPLAIRSGNISYSGSVKLLQAEYEQLRTEAGGSILNLRDVSIQVSVADGLSIVTHSISGVSFTEGGLEAAQAASHLTIDLPFLALDVVIQ